MRKVLILTLALLSGMLTAVNSVMAQTHGVGVTPAITELVLEEGQDKVELKVDVVNKTGSVAEFVVSTLDFGALDDSGGVAFAGRTSQEVTSRGLSRWMQLDKTSFSLNPGESSGVLMTVINDDSLSPGGHYGAVIVSEKLLSGPGGDEVAVQSAASSLVLLRKKGGENFNLELESINTNKSLFSIPSEANLKFANSGNVHAVPRGTVKIFTPGGKLLRQGIINEQSAYVLPGSNRDFRVNILGSSAWLPGSYKIETSWRYDGQEEFIVEEQNFWFIGRLTIYIFIILCLVYVLIIYIKYRKRPITRY